ncbi:small multidrug resistance family-3 protein [Rhodobacter viridis]|uniref:Small multidrug resistance family-3 protein n=1 Tax=Rhodobacter viridis TaxID=1054202 RepID=A0A318TQF1_9RHOB|nr:YnfA family protein [Rhodobacter viridis]PYF06147.1 small multidrug resistance family-3 protein [Rhodobacter viridis]
MKTLLYYAAAAFTEIFGCYAVWLWWRLDRPVAWLLPAMGSLAAFAWLLAQSPADQAGRAYAIYGGIYIVGSLVWLWAVEGARPDAWDMFGALICLGGAAIILFAPRAG